MENFIPDIYVQSVYSINYKKLKKMGVKCLCFDVDNTLVPYSEDVPSNEVKELFNKLAKDFKVIIMSNNSKTRLRPFKDILNVDTAYYSCKPFKKKYKKIMKLYDYKPEEVASIGDQIMTDVWGAKKVGWVAILVNYMSSKEPFYAKVSRFFENRILNKLHKKGLLEKGDYYE